MKKIILTAAAIFAFGFANAQESTEGGFSKGDLFVSGAFSYDSSKTGDNKENTFSFAPSLGYFVTENISIGGRINYQSIKEEEGNFDVQDSNIFAISAFGRYYWTPSSKFSLFGEAEVGYVSGKNKLTDVKGDGFGIGIAPGVSYFLSDNFAIEASWGVLGYSTFEIDGANDSTNTFNLGLDLSDLNFGLVYKF